MPRSWDIVYFKDGDFVCAEAFLQSFPTSVEAKMIAVLDAVAQAPPPRFSGGGMWEAMYGEMGGYYEVRVQGPGREQFRLFCLLDNGGPDELRCWPRAWSLSSGPGFIFGALCRLRTLACPAQESIAERTAPAVSTILSMSPGVWARLTKAASNWEGGR